jgi:hypothetical protein
MAKEKIAIVGDSFSADIGPESWITMLEDNYTISNYSQRGASEYRLYQIVKTYIEQLSTVDHIIMFHTNSLRVFIPDTVDYPTRKLSTHNKCDLVVGDAMADLDWAKIAETYYKYFFDETYLLTQYQLLIKDIHAKFSKNIIHCTGFSESCFEVEIKSFAELRENYPGTVNHLDYNGNLEIYQFIKDKLC